MTAQLRSAYLDGKAQFRSAYGADETPSGEIELFDDFERSSINVALSTIDTSGDYPIITIQPRRQMTHNLGERWLEPVFGIRGVNGLRPAFQITNYDTAPASGRNHQRWGSNQCAHYSYDGGVSWLPFTATNAATSNVNWRLDTPFTQDEVLIARSWPRSLTRIGEQIEAISAAHPTMIAPTPAGLAFTPSLTTSWPAQAYIVGEVPATVDELGRTVPATPMYAFAIDDQAYSGTKKKSLITAGVHPGEDVGEVVLWEMLDYYTGSSSQAQALRSEFRLIVYPLISTSGRVAGYWRPIPGTEEPSQQGWLLDDDTTPATPSTAVAKAGIEIDLEGEGTAWGFDVHASPTGPTLQMSPRDVLPRTIVLTDKAYALYPAGKWGDYEPRSLGLSGTSTTLWTLHNRLSGGTHSILETNDFEGPISPAVMRPYAEALIDALAEMQTEGYFTSLTRKVKVSISSTADGASNVGGIVLTAGTDGKRVQSLIGEFNDQTFELEGDRAVLKVPVSQIENGSLIGTGSQLVVVLDNGVDGDRTTGRVFGSDVSVIEE